VEFIAKEAGSIESHYLKGWQWFLVYLSCAIVLIVSLIGCYKIYVVNSDSDNEEEFGRISNVDDLQKLHDFTTKERNNVRDSFDNKVGM